MIYTNPRNRPLYTGLAWAYDEIIRKPVDRWTKFMVEALSRCAVMPPALVLDAGCGTGHYTVALSRAGYTVTGLDASAGMAAVARHRIAACGIAVQIIEEDLLEYRSPVPYAAVLCRGVLNDFLTDHDRSAAFASFSRNVGAGGVLMLDVRDWATTARIKQEQPVTERHVRSAKGELTFRSETSLDHELRLQVIRETSELRASSGECSSSVCQFIMRCWTPDELVECMTSHGFAVVHVLGDYDWNVPVESSDRIIAIARKL